ncbi:MAG: FAD:protein FMN transferase, partial [Victivallaceae bacterium]
VNCCRNSQKKIRIMKKITLKTVILSLLLLVFGSGLVLFNAISSRADSASPSAGKPNKIQLQHYVIDTMSTSAELTIYGTQEEGKLALKLVKKSFNRLNAIANRFDDQSELGRLNQSGGEWFTPSRTLMELLEFSVAAGEISGGCFDVTVSPLLELWGFYRRTPQRLPTPEELNSTREKCGFDKIVFSPERRQVRLSNPALKIDLGGIAKGYAVDSAVAELNKNHINCGLLNLSGNLRGLGKMPPDKPYYRIAIRNPFDRNATCGELKITREAVASSGNYERYRIIDGKYYTHIIDPRNGIPVENMLSVTVVAQDAMTADFLSTAIFVGGELLAEKIVSANPEIGIIIYRSFPGTPNVAWGQQFGTLPPGSNFQAEIRR